MAITFDIEGARKAGYTDREIAQYLSEENKFDIKGALSSGYSPAEVITYLSSKSTAPVGKTDEQGFKPNRYIDGINTITGKPIPKDIISYGKAIEEGTPESISTKTPPIDTKKAITPPSKAIPGYIPKRSLPADIAVSGVRGAFGVLPEMFGRAMRMGDIDKPGLGAKLIRKGQEIQEMLPPSMESNQSIARRAITGGIEATPVSVGAGAPGAIVGSIGGPLGALAGYGLSAGMIFGAAEYDRFIEEAIRNGVPPDIAKSKAIRSAILEGGLEGLANMIVGGTLRIGRPLTSPVKEAIKRTILAYPTEIGTEMLQEAGEAKLRQDVGIPTISPAEAAKEAIGPAAVMTTLFGAGAAATRPRIMPLSEAIRRFEEGTAPSTEAPRQVLNAPTAERGRIKAAAPLANLPTAESPAPKGLPVPGVRRPLVAPEIRFASPGERFLIKKPDTSVEDYLKGRGEITPFDLATHGLLDMSPEEAKADLKARLTKASADPAVFGIIDDLDITRPSDINMVKEAIGKVIEGKVSPDVSSEIDKTKRVLSTWQDEQFGVVTKKNKNILNEMEKEIASGRPGERIFNYDTQGQGGTPDIIGIPSTYPDYFRGKGLSAKDTLNIIWKAKNGKRLTENQQILLEDLIRDKRAYNFEQIRLMREDQAMKRMRPQDISAKDLEVGDEFTIQGEKFKVIGEDEKGNKTIKDGKTIVADPFDQVPIDKGMAGVQRKPITQHISALDALAQEFGRKETRHDKEDIEGVQGSITQNREELRGAIQEQERGRREVRGGQVFQKQEGQIAPPEIGHKQIQPGDYINDITREDAGKMMAKGDRSVIHHIEEFVRKKGRQAAEDAIRNEELRQIALAKKGAERETVRARIQEIEPEINKALSEETSIRPQGIGTPDNINTVALSEILLADLKGATTFNAQRLLDVTAKALGAKVGDLKPSSNKAIQEAMEYAVVKRAREIMASDVSEDDKFEAMKRLYNQQPNLSARTSTSIKNQQYSTPAPLAYLMNRYLDITPQDSVYEPTAGNGMLVIGANPKNTWVNEIGARRLEHLRDSGYQAVTSEDASKTHPEASQKTADAVVMNPPFGTVPAKTYDGFKISKLEHQIAIEALRAMNDDGRAAFIIGGHNFKDGKMLESDRVFLNYIYSHYNVTHNIDIDGEVYRKMGTSYPIRLITIEGRKPTPDKQFAPTQDQVESAADFGNVKEILEKPVRQDIIKPEEAEYGEVGLGGLPGRVGEEVPQRGRVEGPQGGVRGTIRRPQDVSQGELFTPGRGGEYQDRLGEYRGTVRGEGVRREDVGGGAKRLQPLGVPGRTQGQQSRLKASDLGNVSTSDFDALINRVISERKTPTISEEVTPYGEGFDEARYQRVKPLFTQALDEFTQAGKSLEELVRHLIENYDEGIIPYLRAFHKDISVKKEKALGNEYQVIYTPKSSGQAGDNLIPKNMAQAVSDSLDRLSQEIGDLDAYVQGKLDYANTEALHRAFSAEQIDGLSMAIHAIDGGQAVIAGDQTGTGKGRIAAGIIRYANKLGLKPIFFTANPKLFSDIYRDLTDIDHKVTPFIVHADVTKASIYDMQGNVLFKPAGQKGAYESISKDPSKALSKYHTILVPYSQIQRPNTQQRMLMALTRGNIIVLDESHLASGESTRGKFIRELIKNAKGVLYLSATYAKRPDTMPLYYRTALGTSGLSIDSLVSAVENGGVPLQQYIASNLAEQGQYIRRELNFSDVRFEVEVNRTNEERDVERADAVTDVLRDIVAWDRLKQKMIEKMDKEAKKEGQAVTGESRVDAGVTSSNFASTVHNNVNQLLLGLKAETAIKKAMTALREGKKPIITLMNTMESFLDDVVKNKGINVGDPVGFSFRDVLRKALEGTLRYTIKDPYGNKTYGRFTPDELPDEYRDVYQAVLRKIEALQTDLPASPIDYIKSKLSEAGHKVGEITGREYYIDYGKKVPTLERRTQKEINDRNRPVNDFNSGKTDALIFNAAGATGLSLHASEKFSDKRVRRMIVIQPDLNIDTFMQSLGRIYRKGQVVSPEYLLLQTVLPAEIRPAVVLSKKMSSLNANTSANKDSATSLKGVPDMMNHVGDNVVVDYLLANKEINNMLGDPLEIGDKERKRIVGEDAFKKVSGKVALLPAELQRVFYEAIEQDYKNHIDYLNQLGENTLETKDYDFEAKTLKKTLIHKGKDESQPFQASTYLETVSVKTLKKPYPKAKVEELIAKALGGKSREQYTQDLINTLVKETEDYKKTLASKQTLLGRLFGGTNVVNEELSYVRSTLQKFQIGYTYNVSVSDEYEVPGVLIDIRRSKGGGSPVAPSKFMLIFAVADTSQTVAIPMSKRTELRGTLLSNYAIRNDWDSLATAPSRETRYIITGNLIQGYERFGKKAELITYTDDQGKMRQGILIPKSIKNPEITLSSTAVDVEDALKYILKMFTRRVNQRTISSTNGEVELFADDDQLQVSVPKSKQRGAKYFLNEKIRSLVEGGEFTSRGNVMQAYVVNKNLKAFLEALQDEANIRFAIPAEEVGAEEGVVREETAGYGKTEPAPTFHSQMQRILEAKLPQKGHPNAFRELIKGWAGKGEFKQDEYKWSGVDEWLSGQKGTITRQEVLDWLRANEVRVEEVEKGIMPVAFEKDYQKIFNSKLEDIEDYEPQLSPEEQRQLAHQRARSVIENYRDFPRTRFSQYTLPGGRDYRELLLILPWRPGHGTESLGKEGQYEVFMDGDFWGRFVTQAEAENAITALRNNPNNAGYTFEARPTRIWKDLQKTSYKSPHWDEPNVLAHVRFNERTDADGKKVLFLEELQSDWAAEGRREGFKDEEEAKRKEFTDFLISKGILSKEGNDSTWPAINEIMLRKAGATEDMLDRWRAYEAGIKGFPIPNAPLLKDWQELALKRILRYAAENGFDRVAWTTGEMQKDRYDLSKHLSALNSTRMENGNYHLLLFDKEGRDITEDARIPYEISIQELPNYVGKELAEKIIKSKDEFNQFSGLDLKVGGQWANSLYDQMIPQFLNKYGKKWGARVGETKIPNVAQPDERVAQTANEARNNWGRGVIYDSVGREVLRKEDIEDSYAYLLVVSYAARPRTVPYIDITPSMKKSVLEEGQPLFEKRAKYGNIKEVQETTYAEARKELDRIAKGERVYSARGRLGVSRTLGLAIRRDLIKGDRVDLRGHEIKSAEDLAVLAQVLRNPQFETFRIFAFKDDKVVASRGISSRMPGSSSTFIGSPIREIGHLIQWFRRTGADSFAFMHNHPTGDPMPSDRDLNMTKRMISDILVMADRLKIPVKFKWHIIIDSGKYASIEPYVRNNQISMTVEVHDLPQEYQADELLTPEIAHDLLYRKIGNDKDLALVGRALKTPDNFVSLIYADAKLKVRALEMIPINQFKDTKNASGYIRNRAREAGAAVAFAYYDGSHTDRYVAPANKLMSEEILEDALYMGSPVWAGTLRERKGHWMGLKGTETAVRVSEEMDEYIRQGWTPKKIIDRIFRLPFKAIGKLDADGRWRVGVMLHKKLVSAVTEKNTDGKYPMVDRLLDTLREGLIDKYGMPDEYIGIRKLREMERNAISQEGLEFFHELRKLGEDQLRTINDILTNKEMDPGQWENLTEPIRNLIMHYGQEMVDAEILSPDAFKRNRAQYLHRSYEKYRYETPAVQHAFRKIRLIGKELKHRGKTKYVSPKEVMKWVNGEKDGKNWEYRGVVERQVYEGRTLVKKGSAIIWRDWTKEERQEMGEVEDAAYNVAMTFDLIARDLSTGKLYKRIAEDPLLSSDESIEGWVHFGNERISKSSTPKWGALAGKYVHPAVARDLKLTEKYSQPSTWRWLLTQWKLSKTARNPVVHTNNMVSNFFLADMHDMGASEFASGITSLAQGDPYYQEARGAGVFGHNIIQTEIRKFYHPEISKLARSGNPLAMIWGIVKRIDAAGIKLYSFEDDIFRMALFKKLHLEGKTVEEAAAEARRQFIDYDISAPWIMAARNTVIPFISYPYRAIPLIAEMAMTRPWKLIKYAVLFWALEVLAEAMLGVDADEERKLLPEQQQGKTWLRIPGTGLGIPKQVRIPWGFFDVSRKLPGADITDLSEKGALPIPNMLVPGGPIVSGLALVLNVDPFTLKKIRLDSIPINKQAEAVSLWLWRQLGPNAPWVPYSYSFDKIINAYKGVTDELGRPLDLKTAIPSTLGVKISPFDPEIQRMRVLRNISRDIDEAQIVVRQAGWRLGRGEITVKRYNEISAEQKAIIDRLIERMTDVDATAERLMRSGAYAPAGP